MALNVGELVGYLSVDDSKWKSGIAGAQGDLTRLGTEGQQKGSRAGAMIGGALGGALTTGLVMAGAKLKQFAFGAVDVFAAVEDAAAAAGVIFGQDVLPNIVSFADKAASSFGMSKRAALDAQNTFATLGKSAGLAGEPLAAFSQKLTGLAGDLASFKGTTTEEAILAVGAALRGEMEPIRRYGVLLDDQTLRLQAVKMGLISTVKEGLTPANKVLASQALILAQTTDAQGDYIRTSTSTANVAKTLAAETENAQAILGQKLAPAVTAVRQAMLWLVKQMTVAVDVISTMVRWLKEHPKLLLAIGLAISPLIVAIVLVVKHWETLRNVVTDILNEVLKKIQGFVNLSIKAFNILIKAWNWVPFHKDVKLISEVEFPQFATAAERAAERAAKAFGVAQRALQKFRQDEHTLGDPVADGGGGGGGGGSGSGSSLKDNQDKVKKTYKDMRDEIASFIQDKSELTQAAGLREVAAQNAFENRKSDLTKSYNKAMAAAQKSYDEAETSEKKRHSLALIDIEKSYQSRVTQLNQEATTKRQSIVQKSIDILTGAFASATNVDVGKLFSTGSGIGGLLNDLKNKLFGARDLSKNAAALAAQGFSQTFIQQVVSQGPEAGNAMSEAILAATPEAAGELKTLFKEIQDVSDTGLDTLATSMNSGASLATRALMAEYAQVGTDLQVLLAEAYTALEDSNAKENQNFTDSIAASQKTLAEAQVSALEALTEGLSDAQIDLAAALLDSADQFNRSLEDMQRDTMAKLAALQKELKATAALIASVSGVKASSIISKAPSTAGLFVDIPKATTVTGSNGKTGAPSGLTPYIENMTVVGYDPDEAVKKFGQELQWALAGGAW